MDETLEIPTPSNQTMMEEPYHCRNCNSEVVCHAVGMAYNSFVNLAVLPVSIASIPFSFPTAGLPRWETRRRNA